MLQNGVDHEERVAPFVGATPILPAVVSIGAEVLAPGRIRHHAYSSLEVPDGELGRAFAALFAGSDLEVTVTADFRSSLWRKLVSNVTASPITALTGRRIEVMADPAVRELAVGLAAECIAVARAEGAAIPVEAAALLVEGIAKNAAGWPPFGSSMLYDRLAGRETEHEALTGAVVRIGARHGIATPAQRGDAVAAAGGGATLTGAPAACIRAHSTATRSSAAATTAGSTARARSLAPARSRSSGSPVRRARRAQSRSGPSFSTSCSITVFVGPRSVEQMVVGRVVEAVEAQVSRRRRGSRRRGG